MQTSQLSLIEQKSDIEKIIARAFDNATSYDVKKSKEILEHDFLFKTLETNPLLVTEPHTKKMLAVLEYGVLVFFNFEELDIERITTALKVCSQRQNKIIHNDTFTLYLSPRLRKPEGTDELYIKEFNRDIALLVSIVLARSVSLEYYETLVNNTLATLEETVSLLASEGRIPRNRQELAKQIGFGLSVEHELAYNLSILDDPDVMWDSGTKMNQLYQNVKNEFSLEERIKIIQQKISIISRSSNFIISRLEAQRSNMLEWIIIVLILSEIVLILLGKI